MAEKPIWYTGTCDTLLAKIKAWHEGYDFGAVHSTRKFLDLKGNIVDKVTKRAHQIAFVKQEIDSLRAIVQFYCMDRSLVLEIEDVCKQWESNGLLLGRGLKRITLSFYPEHVKAIFDLVSKARREHIQGDSLENLIQGAKDTGKDLFEV